MKMKKPNKSKTDVEWGVDSRYTTLEKRHNDGKHLMEARLNRLNNLSRQEIVKAKLMALKLQMEDYLKKTVPRENHSFTSFLSTYIDIIYDKRASFAQDINITPVSLSQIINNHREPKEEFMLRLMLHSELTYKGICDFQKRMWYEVYYHEKVCDLIAHQNEWKNSETKHVKIDNAALR